MSIQSWKETLVASVADGTALTAAAAASAIPATALITIPPNWWYVGRMMRLSAQGRISNVVTTPGTARFDVRHSAISIFDTGAQALNTTAKTNVPWWLEILLTCRSIGSGTAATIMGMAQFTTESIIASAAAGAGGIATVLLPAGAPAVGSGFDSTIANIMDFRFTQTVATGSLTVHQYNVEALN